MVCGILALNCESYSAFKLALDSRVMALVSRVQALALKVSDPIGLGLGLEGTGLGLVLGLWILASTTTLPFTRLLTPFCCQIN